TWLPNSDPVNLHHFRPQMLNVLNASYFANIVHFHASYEQVAHQVVCVSNAYICVIYALSTWMYHSNYYRSRQEMRYVLATMLGFMIVSAGVSTFFFQKKISYDRLTVCTDLRLLFTSMAVVGRTISLILSIFCIVILLLALVLVIVKITKSKRK
ncbi:hypothetical protein KR200_005115, partial [Drosophila serrata]